ncbi:hypothetical protein H632_c3898p1 [Helicosporidium sp. ATCC 50920]|nr:hypothetical protein H632_c3898p1 [Helicosporidium sp. ATCC 50920]|eukprot:KDD72079.1 hypothetical protein H632_c3898p1 [Helicosporidium sp. ATCC 50920]
MAELAALQHAKPRPETRDETAVLDLVVPVVREYVRLGCRKLTEQLPKVIAGGMLSTPAHVEEALMALVPV